MRPVRFGAVELPRDGEVVVIAEGGVNHDGDPRVAHRLVDVAGHGDADFLRRHAAPAAQLVLHQGVIQAHQLQIVLMGQPELRDRLNNPRLRQLRQRITVRYHLRPLTREEVIRYVQHRLHVSGGNGTPYFTRPALWRVHHYSQGIPRLVNAVCDKALLAGFVQQSGRINFQMVGRAIRELEGDINA